MVHSSWMNGRMHYGTDSTRERRTTEADRRAIRRSQGSRTCRPARRMPIRRCSALRGRRSSSPSGNILCCRWMTASMLCRQRPAPDTLVPAPLPATAWNQRAARGRNRRVALCGSRSEQAEVLSSTCRTSRPRSSARRPGGSNRSLDRSSESAGAPGPVLTGALSGPADRKFKPPLPHSLLRRSGLMVSPSPPSSYPAR